jgi:hypothetical protein
MRSVRHVRRRTIVPILGVAFGMAAAVATTSWSTAVAGQAGSDPGAVFEATHLPPLLSVERERVELEYDVHCAPSGDERVDVGCDTRGTAFVRAGGGASFTALPLEERSRSGMRQLAATVPDELASSTRGIEYFAVLEAAALGRRLVLPAGGAEAPHVAWRLEDAVEIDLGRHAFTGRTRRGARVVAASWGDGAGQIGLERGWSFGPIGASGFDVDRRGEVLVLDQVHRRVLRWPTGAKVPEQVPVSINGTLADVAAAEDGSIFVLETTAPPGRNPLVRRFDDGGRELDAIELGEHGSSQVRIDARGPSVLGGSSHQWLPVMVEGRPASPREQVTRGHVGRLFRGGLEAVALRRENEIRIALVSRDVVVRSWRLTSGTPLAEVQLAEPLGQDVVLVVRVYDEGVRDEFLVLILGRSGLDDRFAVDSVDWAETAPLGRFKLVSRSLYRLGSTREGAFVDRFDLEVR